MNKIINYLKVLIIPLGALIIIPLFLAFLNLLNVKTNNLVIIILMFIIMLISGLFIGKKVLKKGYLKGLLLGFITCLLFFLISLIFKPNYNLNSLIYYLLIIISSCFGSMIGMQKNK